MKRYIKQQNPVYTETDQETWRLLHERQTANLKDKACNAFLKCLQSAGITAHEIPDFTDVDTNLLKTTGWSIEVVPGIIPVDQFFRLLAAKKFCSSTWLRRRDQLNYIEEPDMFHDTYGHIPLLMDTAYANFVHETGILGTEYADNPTVLLLLERLYWFTIEFGLIREDEQLRIFGAGILSSFGESNHVYEESILLKPFSITSVLSEPFRNDQVQNTYFVAGTEAEVFGCIPEVREFIAAFTSGKLKHISFRFEEQSGSMTGTTESFSL